MAGLLDVMNDPRMGLAAGLLSGRDPGGTLAGGLTSGLLQMQNMQQAALQGSLLKAKLDEVEQEKKRREANRAAMQGLLGTAGNAPSDGMGPSMPGTGLLGNPETAPLGGILQALPDDVQGQFLANYALQQAKPTDQTANINDYKFLVSQGVDPKEAMQRVFTQSNAGSNPYFQFLPVMTPNGPGYAVGNARTGGMSIGNIDGMNVVPAAQSPELQGQITGAKTSAEITAKDTAQRAIDLPKVVSQTSYSLNLLDELKKHPGLKYAVGAASVFPTVPGTPQADFVTRLDQVQGQQFMNAYQTLKGGGQITEVEGKKATDAMGRLNRAQSPEEFKKAVTELQDVLQTGMDRAARGITVNPAQPQGGGWGPVVRE